MSILDFLGKEILYFDGAMGTRLQAAGMKPGELPEVWNITHGDIVADRSERLNKPGNSWLSPKCL